MKSWPGSLFGRTALLIAGTLTIFSLIVWQAIVWTVVVPTAELAVEVLVQHARDATAARRSGTALPADTRFEMDVPDDMDHRLQGFAYGTYVQRIRAGLETTLHSPDVRIRRLAAPTEIWVKLPGETAPWLVLSWRVGGPQAPMAALLVLAAAGLIVLSGAALSARRLTAPLAGLAAAAARVAEGEPVHIATDSGPGEVRSLAVAFQSMSNRLAEVDEQRELLLGGISHDLRTPLARIRVAVELLEHEDAALIAEMTASVEEMDRMIGQFLHYVRANYSESPGVAVPDDLVAQALRPYASAGGLSLELQAGEPCCFAVECARHVLLNLVQNAFEYGRTPVIVRTVVIGRELEVSVLDHGSGIADVDWADAIRPFHRLHNRPGDGHTGLGLALIDRLVRMSGGSLRATRREIDFLVTLRLPLLPSPQGT